MWNRYYNPMFKQNVSKFKNFDKLDISNFLRNIQTTSINEKLIQFILSIDIGWYHSTSISGSVDVDCMTWEGTYQNFLIQSL